MTHLQQSVRFGHDPDRANACAGWPQQPQQPQRAFREGAELLDAACLREIALRPGDRVLDLGSGLGQFARAMARNGARVVGIDCDRRQVRKAKALAAATGEGGRVEYRHGRAEAPPLLAEEVGAFDVAIARFLVEHVHRPSSVVRAMVKSVRPGGRVVLLDDDDELLRLRPRAPALARWSQECFGYRRVRGRDPRTGRKLAALLRAAGTRSVRLGHVTYGGRAGQPAFAMLIDNFAAVMERASAALTRHGSLDADTLAAGRTELAAWRRRPNASLSYVVAFATAVRR